MVLLRYLLRQKCFWLFFTFFYQTTVTVVKHSFWGEFKHLYLYRIPHHFHPFALYFRKLRSWKQTEAFNSVVSGRSYNYTQCICSCKQAETDLGVNRCSVVCGRDQRTTSWMPRPHIRVHWERRRVKVQCAPVEIWRERWKHTARVCTDYMPLTSLEITEVKDRFVVCPVKLLLMPLCSLTLRWPTWNITYFYRDCARAFFMKVYDGPGYWGSVCTMWRLCFEKWYFFK